MHDYWWAEHQKTCGGTYIKIKEPENYSKKGKGKTKVGKQPTAAENKGNFVCSSMLAGTTANSIKARAVLWRTGVKMSLRIISSIDICKCGFKQIPLFVK